MQELHIPDQWRFALENPLTGEDVGFDEDLLEYVEIALEKNFDLRAIASNLDRSEALYAASRGDRTLRLEVGFDASRGEKRTGTGSRVDTRGYGTWMSAAWEVDLWGKIGDRLEADNLNASARRAAMEASRLSLAARVARGWFHAITSAKYKTYGEQVAASYRATLHSVEERYRMGLSEALDLSMARAALAQADADLEALQINYVKAIQSLQLLAGYYPDGKMTLPENLPGQLPPYIPALPSQLLHNRPDLVAARLHMQAADLRWSAAIKEKLPSLSLSAGGRIDTPRLADALDPLYGIWSLASGLSQPLFDGGRIHNQAVAEGHEVNRLRQEYCSLLLNAFSEVEGALNSDKLLREQLRLVTETVIYAEDSWNTAVEQYHRGNIDLLSLLANQRTYLDSRFDLIDIQEGVFLNRLDLIIALGQKLTPEISTENLEPQ